MKISVVHVSIVLFLLILFTCNLNAQILARTEMGIEVYLYEDGTWKIKKSNSLNSVRDQQSTSTKDVKCNSIIVLNNVNKVGKINLNITSLIEENVTIATVKIPFNGQKSTDAVIFVEFQNGRVHQFRNNQTHTKNQNFTIYFGSRYKKLEEREMFQTVLVKEVRIKNKNVEIKHGLTKKESEDLKAAFNCN